MMYKNGVFGREIARNTVIFGVYAVLLAGKSPNFGVYLYPFLAHVLPCI